MNFKITLPTSHEFPAQLMSVRTVKMFKSDVPSVLVSHVHIYAVDHTTDSLLCQCSVLIKTTPLFNHSFFQMVDATDLAAMNSFLQNAPNRIVHRIEIWTVQWPIRSPKSISNWSINLKHHFLQMSKRTEPEQN